ncbi:MAG: RuBisCO large subunit C-terminal-like domain-containing protein [Anaerolineales bacterium]
MTLPAQPPVAGLSGERFRIHYTLLADDEADAHKKAHDICLEQTVEFPDDLVPDGDIRAQVVGQVDDFEALGEGRYAVCISYANETAGDELPQLLNVVFGNISIKPGMRVERFELSESLLTQYNGPRFGQAGWRDLLGVHDRPLLMTALKPMGLSAEELAKIAYKCALGGLDIIKDDHGLTNQPFAPYHERVERCAEAVAKANAETGLNCQYMPNVTARADEVIERARFAVGVGAGSLLICPGLVGFDTMRLLADDDAINLPISSHPSFYGSHVTWGQHGFSHYALYGQLQRLAGADSSIYPNFGGRFSFSKAECGDIVRGCTDTMGPLKPIFATPGGGMTMERVPEMREVYGTEVIYLIGGGLHRHSADLVQNVKHFIDLIR